MTREKTEPVVDALRSSRKGQLKYDYFWKEEGRTQAILDEVSCLKNCLNLSPKTLESLKQNESADWDEEKPTVSDDSLSPVKTPSKEEPAVRENEDKMDVHALAAISETELALIEYEEERRRSVQEANYRKQVDYANATKELQLHIEEQKKIDKRRRELQTMQNNAKLQEIEEEYRKTLREKELSEKERSSTQAKRKSAILKEVEMKQRQAEEQFQRREKEQAERRQQLIGCRGDLYNIIVRTKETLGSFEHKKYLQVTLEDRDSQMNSILSSMENIIKESFARDVVLDDLTQAQQLLDNAQIVHKSVSEDIEQSRNKGLAEAEQMRSQGGMPSTPSSRDRSRQVSGSSVKYSAETGSSDIPLEEMNAPDVKTSADVNEGKDLPIYNCIAPSALREYSLIIEQWEQWNKDCQSFISDAKNKTYMFSVRKAITIPINTISGLSGSHVRDKLDRLLMFLSGQSVEVTGKRVSCRDHPLALTYSKGIIAQQFVSQGEGQIASQYTSAFPFAAAMLGLWANHPDIGLLILACFYKKCPYIVPYYPPREEKQSDMDYYKSLGYKYDEDIIEKQDKFLKRMSGFMRLYAAVIQSPLPPGCKGPHPHGMEWGWRWLAHMLNLEPRQDITATLLFDFLEVAGHALQKTYGKQFQKMLHALCKYFPKIESVTPAGSAGPVTRLKDFLRSAIKKTIIPPPEGVLTQSFFYT